MGRLVVANASSVADEPLAMGIPSYITGANGKKRIYLHSISVAPRGANWAADMKLYLMKGFTGNELAASGAATALFSSVAAYESDFTAGVDSWADSGAGAPTLSGNETIGGVDDCLKVLADGGGDPLSISRAATRVAATHYKITFDAFCQTGSTLGNADFMGVGLTTAGTTNAIAHNSGNNVKFAADNAWKSFTLYTDDGADTALDLCAFTAQNADTGSLLAADKYVGFKNIKIYPMTNQDDWTPVAEWVWDYAAGNLSKIVNTASKVGQTIAIAPVVGEVFQLKYTHVRSATGVTPTFGGTAGGADPTAGIINEYIVAASTSAELKFTADATLVGTIDDVSLIKMGNPLDPWLQDSVRSGTTLPYYREFLTKQPYSVTGWSLYLTTGGGSCIMDAAIVYEIV
jgi:hypothetical protein